MTVISAGDSNDDGAVAVAAVEEVDCLVFDDTSVIVPYGQTLNIPLS